MKMKRRQRESVRDGKGGRDRISDLPDCVLLYLMTFMDTRHAVQTCVLSKRWKDLWKHLTNLILHSDDFRNLRIFNKFVSCILSSRDGSISVHDLDFVHDGCTSIRLLNRVSKYAASHNIKELTINTELNLKQDFELPHSILSCRSLTYLDLSIENNSVRDVKLPKSLELPALKCLYLTFVTFTTSDNGCAEPFSKCKVLNTLGIELCSVQNDAKLLCITNSNLSSLTFGTSYAKEESYKVSLCTPKLSSLTTNGYPVHEISSTCKLPFLEEGNILFNYFDDFPRSSSLLMGWLKVFANVKRMKLSSRALKIINDLSNQGSMTIQPPCFVKMKSLTVEMYPYAHLSTDEVRKTVECLLQNSPLAIDGVINV
ncbi:hypothetical protein TanjilG_20116 [Lupinus angustifolius]|uniref:Uncharacterized protein n=1 Tax=Lupinus angustifolius TaxID=3871 RepID=A0A4P1RCS0_LUPAN|nr:PREDICTED: F-box/LRR-repeat protein 13-like [Lupinus angustifolius]XP_019449633.1 PREDICTED: F-box/LRR-repeat protein 13-like [Lupinus angustifolius]OIW08015.1 hypothetical protein TanjilG_20116 [Lupinus angustifolius]